MGWGRFQFFFINYYLVIILISFIYFYLIYFAKADGDRTGWLVVKPSIFNKMEFRICRNFFPQKFKIIRIIIYYYYH